MSELVEVKLIVEQLEVIIEVLLGLEQNIRHVVDIVIKFIDFDHFMGNPETEGLIYQHLLDLLEGVRDLVDLLLADQLFRFDELYNYIM